MACGVGGPLFRVTIGLLMHPTEQNGVLKKASIHPGTHRIHKLEEP